MQPSPHWSVAKSATISPVGWPAPFSWRKHITPYRTLTGDGGYAYRAQSDATWNMDGMENLPATREEVVSVVWRLPVGVASVLTYLCRQFRWYPNESDAATAALRRALDQKAA